MPELTELDRQILALERRGLRAASKERAIADLDVPATRYYQMLNELIDRPEALRADPVLVGRLRSRRDQRRQLRSAPAAPPPLEAEP